MIIMQIYFKLPTCSAEWFHGDAFGLTVEKTGMLIGFRCHNCRTKPPPVCPHMHIIGADEGELDGSSAFGIQGSEEAYKSLAPEYEVIEFLIFYA